MKFWYFRNTFVEKGNDLFQLDYHFIQKVNMEVLVQRMVGKELPIAVTRDIGHGTDAKGIMIGQKRYFG